ncbi:enoyl-CoA hydratase/isomerase family protein [Ideonella sp. YS5]|uniref:enoyl-CoA hydratase/isomerase family protein n=1 Tax=Ideonella sp. YS5 TaxID=3453714 RepID=UPI003EEABD0C
MTRKLNLDRDGAVARIVLNQPEAMNAIGPEMARELATALAELARDDAVRCVIVTGAGRHFMAGGDVRYFAELLRLPAAERDARLGQLIADVGDAVATLRAMRKPVIAAVRGAVAGFGLSLMCACDLAVAGEGCSFKMAYCQLGASPDGGGSHSLPRLLGVRRALELALLDERIDARRALEFGLVTRVVPDESLDSAAMELAQGLARQATAALGRTKQLIHAAFDNDLAGQLDAERRAFVACAASEDFAEAVAAFAAKRRPNFGGR